MFSNLGVAGIRYCILIPRRGVARSCGNSVLKFLRNLHTLFHSDYTNLYPHQQCVRVPSSPQPLWHLSLLVLLTTAILIGVRWHLIAVLICISLITIEVEHLFIRLLAICMSSWEKCLFKSSANFLIGLFVFFIVELYEFFMSSLGHYQRYCLQTPYPLWIVVSLSRWQFLLLSRSFSIWYSPIHLFLLLLPLPLRSNS